VAQQQGPKYVQVTAIVAFNRTPVDSLVQLRALAAEAGKTVSLPARGGDAKLFIP